MLAGTCGATVKLLNPPWPPARASFGRGTHLLGRGDEMAAALSVLYIGRGFDHLIHKLVKDGQLLGVQLIKTPIPQLA